MIFSAIFYLLLSPCCNETNNFYIEVLVKGSTLRSDYCSYRYDSKVHFLESGEVIFLKYDEEKTDTIIISDKSENITLYDSLQLFPLVFELLEQADSLKNYTVHQYPARKRVGLQLDTYRHTFVFKDHYYVAEFEFIGNLLVNGSIGKYTNSEEVKKEISVEVIRLYIITKRRELKKKKRFETSKKK